MITNSPSQDRQTFEILRVAINALSCMTPPGHRVLVRSCVMLRLQEVCESTQHSIPPNLDKTVSLHAMISHCIRVLSLPHHGIPRWCNTHLQVQNTSTRTLCLDQSNGSLSKAVGNSDCTVVHTPALTVTLAIHTHTHIGFVT